MKLLQIGCLLAILAAHGSTQAQWQWMDSAGRKVFSDRPPPSDISEKNILKRPALTPVAPKEDAPPTEEGAAAPVAKKPVEDKQLQARKKQLADAEAAKQSQEMERVAKVRAENCVRARQSKVTYESGLRINRINANGEHEYMDEAAVAAELRHVQSVMDSDCK